jgi:nitroreductase
MDVYKAIYTRRSIRRFQQQRIPVSTLKKIVDTARVAPSAANLQPLRYILVDDPALCAQIFETIAWAGYIKPAWTPAPNERPTAFIVICVPKETGFDPLRDVGLAAENMMLAAEGEGLGSCMLMKIKREKIRSLLAVPDTFLIDSMLAFGFKGEHPTIEDLKNSVEYWRDDQQVLHVPKRKLSDIVSINSF